MIQNIYKWLPNGLSISVKTQDTSTKVTDHHDITETTLEMVLNIHYSIIRKRKKIKIICLHFYITILYEINSKLGERYDYQPTIIKKTATWILICTVEPVWSDKNFRSQNISLTFFVKKPWVFRNLSLSTSDTVLRFQCY